GAYGFVIFFGFGGNVQFFSVANTSVCVAFLSDGFSCLFACSYLVGARFGLLIEPSFHTIQRNIRKEWADYAALWGSAFCFLKYLCLHVACFQPSFYSLSPWCFSRRF